MEAVPQVFIQVVARLWGLKELMPEVDALLACRSRDPSPGNRHRPAHPERAWSNQPAQATTDGALGLPAARLGKGLTRREWPRHIAHEHTGLKLIKAVNERSQGPRRTVRNWHCWSGICTPTGHRALELKASTLLELLQSFDVYRRPQRFEEFIAACEMVTPVATRAWSSEVIHRRTICAEPRKQRERWRCSLCWSRDSRGRNRARR